MTAEDAAWIQKVLREGRVKGPVLELGVGYGSGTSKEYVEVAGLKYFGSDIHKTGAVDFVANFENAAELEVFKSVPKFGSILIFNVLEHCFDPIRVLDNASTLLDDHGKLLLIIPASWPVHDFPIDCWRALPSFFEEYSRRRGLHLDRESFEYLGRGRVDQFQDSEGKHALPPPATSAKQLWSRVVHRALRTSGRSMFFPSFLCIGAILEKR